MLVAVCDSGDVCIWLQDDLSKPPITVQYASQSLDAGAFWFISLIVNVNNSNDVSTWSLSSSSADSKIVRKEDLPIEMKHLIDSICVPITVCGSQFLEDLFV